MALKLAYHLQKDYDVIDNEIVYKHTVIVKKPSGEEFEIPKDWFWILRQTSKENREYVTNCSKILKHSACIKLAEEFKIDLTQIKNNWLMLPTEANDFRAVVEATHPSCIPIIGEASPSSLNSTMKSYLCTMASKRAHDKIITFVSGVYQYGFYSQSETGGKFVNNATTDDDDEPEKPISPPVKKVSELPKKYSKEFDL